MLHKQNSSVCEILQNHDHQVSEVGGKESNTLCFLVSEQLV